MANQRGETTSIGHFYNRCVDAVNNLFDTMSFWTHSKDVEFVDGKTAETKVGAINGITSDMSGEADDIAASIKCVNQLNNSLGSLRFGYDETNKKYGYYVTDSEGADTFYPFSSGKKVKSVTFNQNIWTTHSQTGTGSSTFTLTITVNFTDAEVPAVSSISASGFQKVGNYELRDYGRTVTGITYY